ncbi:siphovirus Gp157 family protein [Aureimonas ureilytica]|uniref:siphovirus Gp157 family protein n=1 Tax=Aureimonas ureilytica TaxID=401562 RepID=UPI00037D2EA7|nr:siphovirus Gp157 family protein [Aureimonas ureilytica]
MTNPQYLAYDVTVLEREFADLIAAFPELAEDEGLRADTIEGETNAHRVLSRIVAIERDADSMSKAIAERKKDLDARKARQDRRKEAMRSLLFRLLKASDLPKVTLPEATVSIGKKAATVEIIDETAIPKRFMRVKSEPDRAAIKEALDAGKSVKGAQLGLPGETLTVRAV